MVRSPRGKTQETGARRGPREGAKGHGFWGPEDTRAGPRGGGGVEGLEKVSGGSPQGLGRAREGVPGPVPNPREVRGSRRPVQLPLIHPLQPQPVCRMQPLLPGGSHGGPKLHPLHEAISGQREWRHP